MPGRLAAKTKRHCRTRQQNSPQVRSWRLVSQGAGLLRNMGNVGPALYLVLDARKVSHAILPDRGGHLSSCTERNTSTSSAAHRHQPAPPTSRAWLWRVHSSVRKCHATIAPGQAVFKPRACAALATQPLTPTANARLP